MNSPPDQFTLYRDPRTQKVLTRYQILLKWYRQKEQITLNQTRITLYTMRRDEQDLIIQQAVEYFSLIPVNANSLNQSYKQLFLFSPTKSSVKQQR